MKLTLRSLFAVRKIEYLAVNQDFLILEISSKAQRFAEESADFVCIGRDLTKHKQAERDRLLATIARQIRQSLKLEEILNTTVAEVRQLLQTDRVVIYRFNPDWSAIVAVESVSQPDWSILDKTIAYPCFGQSWVTPYTEDRIQATQISTHPDSVNVMLSFSLNFRSEPI